MVSEKNDFESLKRILKKHIEEERFNKQKEKDLEEILKLLDELKDLKKNDKIEFNCKTCGRYFEPYVHWNQSGANQPIAVYSSSLTGLNGYPYSLNLQNLQNFGSMPRYSTEQPNNDCSIDFEKDDKCGII